MNLVSQTKAIRQLRILAEHGREMRLAADGWRNPFQTLIAIIMSARTRDETTIKVAQNLFKHYPEAKLLAQVSASTVARLIRPVNFFRNKSKAVLSCAQILSREYGGVPPRDIHKLVLLPGVGRKTANVFLAQYGKEAIGVDTHVSYISRALGWSNHADPHKIEKDLERLFPKRLWRSVNVTCVRFGKTFMSRKKKKEILEHIHSL